MPRITVLVARGCQESLSYLSGLKMGGSGNRAIKVKKI